MRIQIEFHPEAESDLDAAVTAALQISRRKADEFADSYERVITNLLEYPFLGHAIQDNCRQIPISGSPYSVVYRLKGDVLRVLAFPRASQPPSYWSGRS